MHADVCAHNVCLYSHMRTSLIVCCVQLQSSFKRHLYRYTHTCAQMIGGLTIGRIIVQSCLTNPPHVKWSRLRFKTFSFSKTELNRAWYVETGKRFQSVITPLQVNTHSSLPSAEFVQIGCHHFIEMLFLQDRAICNSKLSIIIVRHSWASLIQI